MAPNIWNTSKEQKGIFHLFIKDIPFIPCPLNP